MPDRFMTTQTGVKGIVEFSRTIVSFILFIAGDGSSLEFAIASLVDQSFVSQRSSFQGQPRAHCIIIRKIAKREERWISKHWFSTALNELVMVLASRVF